ncbi:MULTISPECIES: hypothetical protein [unclassified Saccharothrix]|uniref:hypothetical protein n=1 Tax=unclassified Saccharothrix TaxID=2593673 RepID=UPI00307D16CC
MSDGNTVPLTHPAPPVSAPYPVPDTSTTQVITAADLPQTAAGPFAAAVQPPPLAPPPLAPPADGATVTLSAPGLSEAPTFATTVQPTPPAPADAPTLATGAQPVPPADAPTLSTGAQPVLTADAPTLSTGAQPVLTADAPTLSTGAQPVPPADAPTFATTVQPTPPAPTDAPTFSTGVQPVPPADAPALSTGAQPVVQAPAPTAPAPAGPAPTDQSATQVIKPETLAGVSPNFATAAQTDLQKATTALDAVDKEEVKLDLDKQAVHDLLKLITQARDVVDGVHRTAVDSLDVELKFGNNWVGEAISRRLREVAVGDDASAVSVIGDFLNVLFEVEKTIRDAARNLEDADDEAADVFGKAAGEVKGP